MFMMGGLSFFLGLQVKQTKDGIFQCQSKYCKEILKKIEMESCKEASTPMPSSCYMDADVARKGVDQTKYRGLIGSLLYLTTSRPDIMFTVCLCARYQANPKESHFKAAKRILKYLKGTTNVGLWYPSHSPIHLFLSVDLMSLCLSVGFASKNPSDGILMELFLDVVKNGAEAMD